MVSRRHEGASLGRFSPRRKESRRGLGFSSPRFMRILFDQGTPVPLRNSLTRHTVATAYEMGWSTLDNGDLLTEAERADFQLVITTDQNLRYQQNLQNRRIAILILPTTRWSQIASHVAEIVGVIDTIRAGEYRELNW